MAGNEPPASFGKRLEALALTAPLFVVTLGIGWLVWSVFEWRNGRTPSYRLLRLHIVRLSDERPIGLGRSIVRSGLCSVLLLPTMVACAVVGACFVLGASAPDHLFSNPRRAPWDRFTRTRVTSERPPVVGMIGPVFRPIDLPVSAMASTPRDN